MNQQILQIIQCSSFDQVLRNRLLSWNESAFLSFLDENTSKVISKLKSASSIEDQRDIALELFVARALTHAGSQVKYEPHSKGPDFEFTFGDLVIYCEVKRVRETEDCNGNTPTLVDFPTHQFRKLGDKLCEGICQLKSGHPNVLYIRSNKFTIQKCDLKEALKSLSSLSLNKDDSFFRNKGFSGTEEYLERQSYLSAIIFDDLWLDWDSGSSPVRVLKNQDAACCLSEPAISWLKTALGIPFCHPVEPIG